MKKKKMIKFKYFVRNIVKDYLKHGFKVFEKLLKSDNSNLSEVELIDNSLVLADNYTNSTIEKGLIIFDHIIYETFEDNQ